MADCGVYRITCTANGKVYIGSSLSIRKRFWEHRGALRYGRHHSLLLQRAWNKYGEGAFVFEPVLYCSPEDRCLYEQALIDGYKAADPAFGMNRSPVAKGSPPNRAFLGRKHSPESRRLISERLKGRKTWNKGIPSEKKGIPRTDDDRRKIAEGLRKSIGVIDMQIAREIRAMHATGHFKCTQIADQLDVGKHIVYRVVRNEAWVETA